VRAAIVVWLVALIGAAAAGAGSSGCALFEDRVDRSCKTSADCFRAQGEVCDPDKHVCVAGPDASAVQADPADPAVPAEQIGATR